ncbi:uncharacterized protein LOC117317161 [Pecten maximus]|uniref:uncharacterized protein LOC117317161 n=1 Tax=Pecten maximus TaxID=6579 RepID=UPI0014581597|nr:uncharacterized protein LOC117317161 [Pecten maximus]
MSQEAVNMDPTLSPPQKVFIKCEDCAKSYRSKKSVKRHVRTKHGSKKPYTLSKVDNSPIEYKEGNTHNNIDQLQTYEEQTQTEDDDENEREFNPVIYDVETVYSLGNATFLRINSDCALLQKRITTLKLTFEQMVLIEELSPAIHSCIQDFKDNKSVKYLQELGNDVFIGIQTPYVCVDIRKFFKIPATDQIHPTKIGIPLSFVEFESLVNHIKHVSSIKNSQ